MNQKEIWRDVKDYEGIYQVSDLGRVKSLSRLANTWRGTRLIKDRVLKLTRGSKGYLGVSLHKDKKQSTKEVHQLVATSFLEHVPNGAKIVCDHINNIKTDNRLENLQLITNRENSSKDKKGYTSKYVGVSWSKERSKWRVLISINGKLKGLGCFDDELEAAKAYQKALCEIN